MLAVVNIVNFIFLCKNKSNILTTDSINLLNISITAGFFPCFAARAAFIICIALARSGSVLLESGAAEGLRSGLLLEVDGAGVLPEDFRVLHDRVGSAVVVSAGTVSASC